MISNTFRDLSYDRAAKFITVTGGVISLVLLAWAFSWKAFGFPPTPGMVVTGIYALSPYVIFFMIIRVKKLTLVGLVGTFMLTIVGLSGLYIAFNGSAHSLGGLINRGATIHFALVVLAGIFMFSVRSCKQAEEN